ncbi:MAG: GTPase domain-containing protein [Tatlockia sp.]|nr:GTPase domain-containing protein [Tatlockia sp.]
MPIRILFFGQHQSGKTKLINRMLSPELPKTINPNPSTGIVINRNSKSIIPMVLLDTSGHQRFVEFKTAYFKGTDIAVYCVDLSVRIDHEQIDYDLLAFRKENNKAPIILVGTKSDLLQEESEINERLLSIRNNDFAERLSLSALDDEALAAFMERLNQNAKARFSKKTLKQLINLDYDFLLYARNRLTAKSAFYQALDMFIETVQHLPQKQYCALGREACLLVDAFYIENKKTFSDTLARFVRKCNTILKNETPYLKNIILSIAAAAFFTVLAATVGFAVGFSFGLWAVPIAFFSGIITGYAATTLIVSGSIGAFAGLLTAYGLFRITTRGEQAINEIAEAAVSAKPQRFRPSDVVGLKREEILPEYEPHLGLS